MRKIFFLVLVTACFLPWISTPMALAGGIIFSLGWGNPWPEKTAVFSQKLLQFSVVGLGFGLSIGELWTVGKGAVGYTFGGIVLTLGFGLLLGRMLRLRGNTAALISCGTAICGGSAIAAMAPVLGSQDEETAVALATVFTLNALALIVFPVIGHLADLDQQQFGVWAGMAIHDTSSVVGAAASYGLEALRTGTTVKLTRAVWIAPLALGVGLWLRSGKKAKFPLFIIGFITAAMAHSLFPQANQLWDTCSAIARQCLVATLFLVGCGLSRELMKKVGSRALIHGVILWLMVSALTLGGLHYGLIH